ncbi:MAG TPA: cytochrome c oxidase assembly factor Coa1 family protein [Pyrinomonadaceae bacterium]|nr:cytochrome c oxidase assembly factor Coa1 family protein [Pyrinomonadaceae bacterium]
MATRKILLIVGLLGLTIGLLVLLVVGGIIGLTFYSIGKSQAAETAKTFLRNNEILKKEIGEVRDFGWLVTGNINVQNNDGHATLRLKVIGEQRTVNATVEMMYSNGGEWRVTAAQFQNENGRTVDLLNAYNARRLFPPPKT